MRDIMKKMNMTELSKPVAYIADCGTIVSDSDPFFDDYKNPQPIYSQEYVSAILSELEAKDKRIAELDRSETQLIEERDVAHDAIDAMYEAATGERPEWSNWFGFADAIEEVAQVGAKLATPVRLPTALFCPEEYAGSLLWSETEAYNKAISKCAERIRAAGLKVEGMSSHACQKHTQEDTPDGKKS